MKNTTEHYEECTDKKEGTSLEAMAETAAEACKQISTRAEEITAMAEGTQGIMDSFFTFLSPNNYKGGDTESDGMLRNILDNNISECQKQQIINACNNTSATIQSNSITSTCDSSFCIANPDLCQSNNNIQINENKVNQMCGVNLAIKALTEKKNSIDAQAAAKSIQEASGLLSGDSNYKVENCNIIDQSMSSASFYENKNTCLNSLDINQTNEIEACAASGNIQKNINTLIQDCIVGQEYESKNYTEANTKVLNTFESTMKSLGISQEASIISSIACVCCCCIVLAIVYMLYRVKTGGFKSSGGGGGSAAPSAAEIAKAVVAAGTVAT